MSDLFHKDIPSAYVEAVFDTMEKAHWHVYQVLTKRSSLLQKFINHRYASRTAPAHIWFGVSVENEQATSRIVHLQKARAAVRFLYRAAHRASRQALEDYGLIEKWEVHRLRRVLSAGAGWEQTLKDSVRRAYLAFYNPTHSLS
jgi:protein gp37